MSAVKEFLQFFYYPRNYEKADSSETGYCSNTAARVVVTAIPFFQLYKPFNFPISLTLKSLHTITSAAELLSKILRGESIENIAHPLLKVVIAIIAVIGTIFAHPIGLLATASYALLLNIYQVISNLNIEKYTKAKAIENCAKIANLVLILMLFAWGGLKIATASLVLGVALNLHSSYKELQKKHSIEGAGGLLYQFQKIITQFVPYSKKVF